MKNTLHNSVAVGASYLSAMLPAIRLPTGTNIIVIEFRLETLPLNLSGTSDAREARMIVKVLIIPKFTKNAAGKAIKRDFEYAKRIIAIEAMVQYKKNNMFFLICLFQIVSPIFPITPPDPSAAKSNPNPNAVVSNSSAANIGRSPCSAGTTNKYIHARQMTIACTSGDRFKNLNKSL